MTGTSSNTNKIEDVSPAEKCQFKKVKYQYLAICCANIIILGQGCAIGWTAPSLPILQSDQSPLTHGKLSTAEASWVGSMSSIGAALGTISFGLITQSIGSKNAMILCAIPLTVFWLIVMYSTYAWHLYVGRLFSGLTGGAFVCIQLFLADIADERIRGRLGSFLSLYVNVGILIGYVGGTYLEYTTVPYIMIVFPVIFFCGFYYMPDTPQFLLKCNRYEEARESLRFYKNCQTGDVDDFKLLKELEHLKTLTEQNSGANKLHLGDFLTPNALKGLLIGPVLMAINQFSGAFTLVNYATTIFKQSGSSIDPNMSTIVLGCLQILGTYCTSMIIDRVGRKCLLIVSAAGTALGMAVMGTYSYYSKAGYDVSAFNTLPIISLSFVIFIASIGLVPVPYVIISEVLPSKIRNVGTTICTTSVSVYAFVMLKSFPYLVLHLELHGCMFLFVCVALSGVLFTILVVPETNGKQLDVMDVMEKNDSH